MFDPDSRKNKRRRTKTALQRMHKVGSRLFRYRTWHVQPNPGGEGLELIVWLDRTAEGVRRFCIPLDLSVSEMSAYVQVMLKLPC